MTAVKWRRVDQLSREIRLRENPYLNNTKMTVIFDKLPRYDFTWCILYLFLPVGEII